MDRSSSQPNDGRPTVILEFSQRLIESLLGEEEVRRRASKSSPKTSPKTVVEDRRPSELPLLPFQHPSLFPPLPNPLPPPEQLKAEQSENDEASKGSKDASEQRAREMAPLQRVLDDMEKLRADLSMDKKEALEKVRVLASELQKKDYKSPSRASPCKSEKESCITCYTSNMRDSLQCSKAVKAFAECARESRQDFVHSSTKL